MRVVGYHFGGDRHAGESSGAVCRHFRLVLSVLEARLLPGRHEAGGLPAPLRRALPDRRAEHDRLPPAARGAVRRWAEQTPPGFRFASKLASRTGAPTVGTFSRARALLGERLGPIRAVLAAARGRGPADAPARLARPGLQLPSTCGTSRGTGSKPTCRRTPSAWARSRARPPSATCACASRRTRRRALRGWAERLRPLLDEGLRVYCYFKHEDEPTAPAYAERLLELLGRAGRARDVQHSSQREASVIFLRAAGCASIPATRPSGSPKPMASHRRPAVL